MKHVLTIAGSTDTCGGAGIQADIKTFSALGTYGMSVIIAVTVQNTQGVFDCQDITPEIIKKQIDAIFTDIEVSAVENRNGFQNRNNKSNCRKIKTI